jgi:hypothetical protein
MPTGRRRASNTRRKKSPPAEAGGPRITIGSFSGDHLGQIGIDVDRVRMVAFDAMELVASL